MIGIILFFATTVWIGAPLTAACLPVLVYRRQKYKTRWNDAYSNAHWRNALYFLSIFGLFATINFFANTPELEDFAKSHLGAFPFLALLPLAYITSVYFSPLDRKLFCALVLIEVIFGAAEFSLGVRSLVGAEDLVQTDFETTDFMYFKRVYGLSSNSSTFALKILFFAAFALPISPMSPLYNIVSDRKHLIYTATCLVVIFSGAFITFNRTTLAALSVHLILYLIFQPRGRKQLIPIILMPAVLMVTTLEGQRPGTLLSAWSYAIEQISVGGRSPVELSFQTGRGYLFKLFWDFALENPFFGNASAKAWMPYRGKLFHAHNSYLTILASNGLLIGIPFLILFFRNFCRNFWVMLPILLFSTTQYGIFWGFSTPDTLFFAIFSVLTLGDLQLTQPRADGSVTQPNPNSKMIYR